MSEPNNGLTLAPVVVNGAAMDWRKTHPALYLSVMTFAILNIGLGLNFIILTPTFPIFDESYYLWGGVFVALGAAKIAFLNLWRHRDAVRVTMGLEVFYMLFLAVGTTEPYIDGVGSLQLPIIYLGLAAFELSLLLEPYINVLTARLGGTDE